MKSRWKDALFHKSGISSDAEPGVIFSAELFSSLERLRGQVLWCRQLFISTAETALLLLIDRQGSAGLAGHQDNG